MNDSKKAVIWNEWQNGTPMNIIAREIEKPPATVFSYSLDPFQTFFPYIFSSGWLAFLISERLVLG